jgi:hypothetical protein
MKKPRAITSPGHSTNANAGHVVANLQHTALLCEYITSGAAIELQEVTSVIH